MGAVRGEQGLCTANGRAGVLWCTAPYSAAAPSWGTVPSGGESSS